MTMVLPRTSLMIFAAASLAGATMAARPAAAMPAAGAPVAQAASDAALATQVQWRGGYGRGYGYRGGYYGRGYYGGGYGYRRGWDYGGAAAAAGIAGLATGAILGGALSQPRTTVIEEPGYAYGGGGSAYCAQRYRSYDPASGTFLGYDGLRHPCP